MKKLVLVVAMLFLSWSLTAQQVRKTRDAVAIGIKGGGVLASHSYVGDLSKDTLAFDDILNRVRPMGGLSLEIPVGKYFFVAPEVLLVGRGDSRLFESSTLDTLVRYQVKTYYLETRLPIAVTVPVNRWLKPYVFAAPAFGLTLPMGRITQNTIDKTSNLSDTVSIGSSNMAPYDFGLVVGAGARFLIDFSRFSLLVKVEAGYDFGLLDTYSWAEHHDHAQAANVNAYNVVGKRLNRGFEASLTVALPLKFLPGDACSNWSDDVYPVSRRGHRHSF